MDEVIIFRHLTEEDFFAISQFMLNEYVDTLKEKGIAFTFDEPARRFLDKKAYGGKSGARDLRNLIRKEVEDKIASAIVDSRNGILTAVNVSSDGEKILLETL